MSTLMRAVLPTWVAVAAILLRPELVAATDTAGPAHAAVRPTAPASYSSSGAGNWP